MASTTTIRTPPDYGRSPLLRVDSPFESSRSISTDGRTPRSDESMSTIRTSPDRAIKFRQPSRSKHATEKPASNSSALRFFVVDHPTQLKDKKQLKMNRKHVMYDYLDKERRRPDSTDARVTGSTAGRKRKRLEVQMPGTSINPASPAMLFRQKQSRAPQMQRTGPIAETSTSAGSTRSTSDTTANNAITNVKTAPKRPIVFVDDLQPLVQGISGKTQYLSTNLEDVPDPTAPLGSGLNPFDTWPRLAAPDLKVEELKWRCSRNFGSQGISAHWVPELLKAKHAFLSTLCISSSHEDIMRRGLQQPHERLPFGSIERWQVRGEVISMINKAMKDPELRATDATIVSVLHLLNSEIMGCDDVTMAIHHKGLHNMVKERGGLNNLGIDGQLASILTITMYMISALRETEPHSDFVRYAEAKDTRPPSHQRQLPESPVYCRPSGYITIRQALPSSSPMLELLEDLRLLTNAFITTSPEIQYLHAKISSTLPASSSHSLATRRYNALLLTAKLYSHALYHRIPFSQTPISHIHIKQTLLTSDLSSCWDNLSGVLFFITLIAGASANPDAPANRPKRKLSHEEEEARKWLAAVAVRCSIVLSFEFGGAMLQTLKMVVGIEQMLAKGGKGEEVFVGPTERPLPQRTFQDFARDFLLEG